MFWLQPTLFKPGHGNGELCLQLVRHGIRAGLICLVGFTDGISDCMTAPGGMGHSRRLTNDILLGLCLSSGNNQRIAVKHGAAAALSVSGSKRARPGDDVVRVPSVEEM